MSVGNACLFGCQLSGPERRLGGPGRSLRCAALCARAAAGLGRRWERAQPCWGKARSGSSRLSHSARCASQSASMWALAVLSSRSGISWFWQVTESASTWLRLARQAFSTSCSRRDAGKVVEGSSAQPAAHQSAQAQPTHPLRSAGTPTARTHVGVVLSRPAAAQRAAAALQVGIGALPLRLALLVGDSAGVCARGWGRVEGRSEGPDWPGTRTLPTCPPTQMEPAHPERPARHQASRSTRLCAHAPAAASYWCCSVRPRWLPGAAAWPPAGSSAAWPAPRRRPKPPADPAPSTGQRPTGCVPPRCRRAQCPSGQWWRWLVPAGWSRAAAPPPAPTHSAGRQAARTMPVTQMGSGGWSGAGSVGLAAAGDAVWPTASPVGAPFRPPHQPQPRAVVAAGITPVVPVAAASRAVHVLSREAVVRCVVCAAVRCFL